jgi:hypothetical protein
MGGVFAEFCPLGLFQHPVGGSTGSLGCSQLGRDRGDGLMGWSCDFPKRDSQKGNFDGLHNKPFNARKSRKIRKNLLEFPFLENLMDYIINFDGLKNPEKSKENYKIFLFWKF